MTLSTFVHIAIVVLAAAVYGFNLYYQAENELLGSVAELIVLAESTGLPGEQKMAQVVEGLVNIIPAPLRAFVNESALEKMAQGVFNNMRQYANMYITRNVAAVDDKFIESIKKTCGRETAALTKSETKEV